MPRKMKYGSGVYAYLESVGVLLSGMDADITRFKKQYWTQYRKEWKKNKRQQSSSYEIQLSFKEEQLIAYKAKQHKISITGFIKQSAICSSASKPFIDQIAIGEIRQLVIQHYTVLLNLMEENELPQLIGNQLLNEAEQIEKKMITFFSSFK